MQLQNKIVIHRGHQKILVDDHYLYDILQSKTTEDMVYLENFKEENFPDKRHTILVDIGSGRLIELRKRYAHHINKIVRYSISYHVGNISLGNEYYNVGYDFDYSILPKDEEYYVWPSSYSDIIELVNVSEKTKTIMALQGYQLHEFIKD